MRYHTSCYQILNMFWVSFLSTAVLLSKRVRGILMVTTLAWSVRSMIFSESEKKKQKKGLLHREYFPQHPPCFAFLESRWIQYSATNPSTKKKEELRFFPLLFTFQCNGKKMRSLTLVPAGLVKIYCTSLNSWVNMLRPFGSLTIWCLRLWVHVCFVYTHAVSLYGRGCGWAKSHSSDDAEHTETK